MCLHVWKGSTTFVFGKPRPLTVTTNVLWGRKALAALAKWAVSAVDGDCQPVLVTPPPHLFQVIKNLVLLWFSPLKLVLASAGGTPAAVKGAAVGNKPPQPLKQNSIYINCLTICSMLGKKAFNLGSMDYLGWLNAFQWYWFAEFGDVGPSWEERKGWEWTLLANPNWKCLKLCG